MMDTFLNNATSQVQDLRLAMDNRDIHEAQTLVQSIRRAAANLGGPGPAKRGLETGGGLYCAGG